MGVVPEEAARLEFALELAREAGELTLGYFGRAGLSVERKGDGSEVTEADKACEEMIRARLGKAFPDDGVLGEEFADREAKSAYRWIVDPIDGTFSFARGVPLYSVLIACERLEGGEAVDGGVRLGVIALPALGSPEGGPGGETVWAVRGGGAWHRVGTGETRAARVSGVTKPEDATVCMTSRDYFVRDNSLAVMQRAEEAVGHARGWSDAYAAVLLATGRIEVMVEPVMFPWDAAPLQVIVAEAGGRCTDWTGRETVHHQRVLATNGHLHRYMMDVIAGTQ
jgi:histidinol-phosphatase